MSADGSAIVQRANELGQALVKLAARADTRTSAPFRTFIDFDAHTHFAVSNRELSRGRTASDPRFGVVGLATMADGLVVAHTDTTSLARLGKVWSLVEADELAMLSIYKVQPGSVQVHTDETDFHTVVSVGEKIFARTLPEKVNSMRLNQKGQIFLGMGDGMIHGFDIQAHGKPFVSIAAHGLQPVIAIDLHSDDSIVSVGLDGGLRVSSSVTGQLIGGGKLTKRLADGEIFRCLHVSDGRAFVGTDKSRVFIFDVSSGSPTYLHMLTMSSYPVRCIHASDGVLLVAYDQSIGKYPLLPKGREKELVRTMQITSSNGAGVHSCMKLPNTQYIVAGFGDGSVGVYLDQALVYARCFAEERINVMHFAGGVLWIGCDDGRIVEAVIPPTLSEDAAYAASHIVEEKPVVPIKTVESPSRKSKPNPACLVQDDSDDDWQRGLFSN